MPSRRTVTIALLLFLAWMPGLSEAQGSTTGQQVVEVGNGALDALAASFNASIHSDQYVPGRDNIIEFMRFIRDGLRVAHPDPNQGIAPKADPADGTLEPFTALVASPIPNCLASRGVAWHPNGRYLYLATAGGNGGGSVCALDFGADGKTMSAIPGAPFAAAAGTRSVAVHPSGNYLYTANFDSNTVSGFAIANNGALTPLPGSPYAAGATPRVIAVDPKGRFVYVTNNLQTSPGAITGFAIDSDTGVLTPLAGSPFVAPQYTGALAIEPRGAYLYVSGSVNQAYAIDAPSGALTAVGAGFGPPASSMTVDPTGRYLYATSGGNLVTGYRIGSNGGATVVGPGVTTGSNPIGITVSRTGRFVFAANLLDGTISGFGIDDATGTLAPLAGSPFAAGENVFHLATTGSLLTAEAWPAGETIMRPIAAWGGKPPYTFSITGGTLPPGVGLDTALGQIAGRATTPGTYTVTIQVADSAGRTAGHAFTQSVTGGVTLPVLATVVEYYNATLDHYFITWVGDEIAKLDVGTSIKGWTRTGKSFPVYTMAQSTTSPVCRYYIPPALGDSHFFGRGTVECNATGQKNPSFVLEDPAFMHVILPTAGVCPASTINVYRVFSNRPDANHRYMTDRATRDDMVAKGWIAEGDGPDLVVMCAPG